MQSATGAVTDPVDVLDAARAAGATTLCDLTQAAGVLPVSAAPFDVTVTHAYKWLCAPRGVAFATFSDRARAAPARAGRVVRRRGRLGVLLRPDMRLAADARRFDVSPAWPAWPGAVAALRHLASVDAHAAWRHATGLTDRLADALGAPRSGQAITTFPDADGAALRALGAAGVTASGRAGRLRLAFHLWNDEDDVTRVADVLGAVDGFRPVG